MKEMSEHIQLTKPTGFVFRTVEYSVPANMNWNVAN